MKSLLIGCIFLLITSSCSEADKKKDSTAEKFTSELLELKEYFQIPGLAISIEQDGSTIYQNYLGVSDLGTGNK
ncbi:MAG: hypothetical protein ACJAWV_000398 [Flammeovirgaceae bacterium]|jgi:hypothetical protein